MRPATHRDFSYVKGDIVRITGKSLDDLQAAQGVLRKELALQLLVALAVVQYATGAENLAAFMTPGQLFTYALVNTLYIPCIATMAVLGRSLGWRRAVTISALTIGLALASGGLAARLLAMLGMG